MKPDGVEAATMEPMQALDTDPVNEAAPLVEGTGEAPPPSQTEEIGQGEQQPAETPAADTKTNKDKPVDPKAKTKGSAKTKTPTSGNRTTTGARPATAQSRVVNGVQKPQANGVAKKTATGTPDKKSMSSSATSKRPVGNASAPGSKTTTTKVNEKKPAGTTRPATAPAATNGTKTAGTTQAKKSTVLPANGVKTKPKTTAPRPATAVTTKPSTTASPKSDRPPVSKTTRPAGGPTSTRPSSAAPKPATSTTAKTSTSPTKPITATAKAASSTSKPSPSKTSTTTPSAGRTPSQASKTTTPIKKDVSKPTTPAAKKPASSPLTRPSTAKTTKPDTPKSATTTKTESASKKPTPKVTDTKTGRPKTQEGKTTASKDVNASPKTPSSKPSTAKATSPKKAVGSSTPMPVKRGPKSPADATPKESEKKEAEKQDVAPALATAAATAAAAAAATAAAVTIAAPEPEPSVEAAVAPVAEHLEPVSTQDIQTTAEVEKPDTTVPQLAAQLDLVQLEGPADDVSPLGTTVMSPPSSPTGPEVQPMEIQSSAPLAGMHIEADLWAQDQSLSPSAVTQESLLQEEVRPQEDVLMPTEVAPEVQKEAEQPFSLTAEPDLIRTSPVDHFAHAAPSSPFQEQEEAVEKAEEEINEDDEDEDEEQEEKQIEKPRMVLETSSAPKMEEFQVESSDFSSSAWDMLHADDTQRSKNIDDFSQMPSEREEPFHGSQAVKAFSNDDEDEAEEVRDEEHDFDFGSKNADDQGKLHQEEEEEDEDVEMVSEEKTEVRFQSYGNLDEDDFAYDSRLDNMARTAPEPSIPMATAWASSNPFADTWAQPPSSQGASSPFSDLGAADPGSPTKSPVEACMDFSAPDLVPQSEQPTQCAESLAYMASHDVVESSFPMESATLAPPPVAMSQSSTLSGTALAAHSSSETSTPEELREYDSSSGVESRSDKQQTPVPTTQPDMEQDLGIHLERGDGEEEEAETLPADEVLGGPPTAPASAPSSPSTSGDEASDTEGEMQINDPDAPVEDTAAFDSSPASHNLPALEEDEEAADMQIGEEDGGTPQSANSVASYGFDCSVSNSNAHSTAESCGKSPGIFSLENEDQLTDEAKDPSLIKELTLPAATANVEDLLGCPVDLLPLGQPGETHEYLLCGKAGANVLEEDDPLESDTHLSPQHPGDSSDGQPPYYSAVCDKTDSFLAGNV